jgi:hypothetical protein
MIDARLWCARMSNVPITDTAATKLRAIVALIDQELGQAPPTPTLRAAWSELVEVLALGPAPETRECPRCHKIGMRAASRCGYCWIALEPLPSTSKAEQENS